MSSKSDLVRKTFPRVTRVTDKRSGKTRYQIDTRKGRGGGRFFRDTEKEALAEAKKLAQEIPVDRGLGIEVSNEVRTMAHKCTAQLTPFGKTIEDATKFYIEHLMEVKRKEESLTIDLLAREWFAEKKAGKQEKNRLRSGHAYWPRTHPSWTACAAWEL